MKLVITYVKPIGILKMEVQEKLYLNVICKGDRYFCMSPTVILFPHFIILLVPLKVILICPVYL